MSCLCAHYLEYICRKRYYFSRNSKPAVPVCCATLSFSNSKTAGDATILSKTQNERFQDKSRVYFCLQETNRKRKNLTRYSWSAISNCFVCVLFVYSKSGANASISAEIRNWQFQPVWRVFFLLTVKLLPTLVMKPNLKPFLSRQFGERAIYL